MASELDAAARRVANAGKGRVAGEEIRKSPGLLIRDPKSEIRNEQRRSGGRLSKADAPKSLAPMLANERRQILARFNLLAFVNQLAQDVRLGFAFFAGPLPELLCRNLSSFTVMTMLMRISLVMLPALLTGPAHQGVPR